MALLATDAAPDLRQSPITVLGGCLIVAGRSSGGFGVAGAFKLVLLTRLTGRSLSRASCLPLATSQTRSANASPVCVASVCACLYHT